MDNNIIDKKLIRQFNEEIHFGYDMNHNQSETLDETDMETFCQWLDQKKLSEYDKLKEDNKRLLEHLKAITYEYEVALKLLAEVGSFEFYPDNNNLIKNSKEAIKKAEQ